MHRLKELLTRERWCQGYYFQDASGRPCQEHEACKFCLSGALIHLYNSPYWVDYPIRKKLEEAVKQKGYLNLVHFNDSSTYEEVMELIDSALA